ncbi:MAG TPA: glycogen debranching protein GlgX [Gaiellaceae bacterium]
MSSPPSNRAQAVWPGRSSPLGATWTGEGTNFSLFSEHARKVELCLFDDEGRETRHELAARTAYNWHGYLPGVGPGQRYGYRVHGPYSPGEGQRFNPAKLLIDPYAKAIDGVVDHAVGGILPYRPGSDGSETDAKDDANAVPKCVVIDPAFDWEGDRLLERSWNETVIYEVHVKGFTKRHPEVRDDLRGTYAGLASDEAIAYLTSLGVTAVELLPVHHIADEDFLHERGLSNYWGYSTVGYLAPHALYAATGYAGQQVPEFKGMVKALHRAGIEVILDVVYNHTAEGGELGPMLAFRGLDNASYYRLDPGDRRRYLDFTGTGNSVDTTHPNVLRLVMDSLRYWVTECHVDGFRFDLATTLAREHSDFDRRSGFLDAIHQDPVLSRVKLIAEPWDVAAGGYQVGNFPPPWKEWNDRYRDTMRDFWRGATNAAAFATRFAGSRDVYGVDGRRPSASINFITAHDGFTLADLVSYDGKHNEANLEGGHDGRDDNRSWNCGAEGPTTDPAIDELRGRQQRNLLATLLLSQGVPMLLGGDERGRTQRGNNNAWCQDNEISWFDWTTDERDESLLEFTRRLLTLRTRNPVFRRPRFLDGPREGQDLPDAFWFRPDGRQMAERNWNDPGTRTLGLFLNGDETGLTTRQGEPVTGDSFLILVNATAERIDYRMPARRFGREWALELTTADPGSPPPDSPAERFPAGGRFQLAAHSLALLRRARTRA